MHTSTAARSLCVVHQALLSKWSCERSQHNKVLIFSHSTRCLDLLEKFVQRAGYDYVRLDGSTAQKQRQMLVDEFNTRQSIFLFLMSTLAGGVGLNLTAANKVVSLGPGLEDSGTLMCNLLHALQTVLNATVWLTVEMVR